VLDLGLRENEDNKKPAEVAGFLFARNNYQCDKLLQLCFFVSNVLANGWIELHDLHFLRLCTLIF
jgi:hypothetical protein